MDDGRIMVNATNIRLAAMLCGCSLVDEAPVVDDIVLLRRGTEDLGVMLARGGALIELKPRPARRFSSLQEAESQGFHVGEVWRPLWLANAKRGWPMSDDSTAVYRFAGDFAHATARQNDDSGVDVLVRHIDQRIGSNVARGRGPVTAGMRSRGVSLNGARGRAG
jgi:hypothetical protein